MISKIRARVVVAGTLAAMALLATAAHAQTAPLQVVDSRPAEQLKSKTYSRNLYDCKFAIKLITGDDRRPPGRMAMLRADLDAAFGSRLAGKTVTVTDYRLVINYSTYATRKSKEIAGGPIGKAVAAASDRRPKAKCEVEKTPVGWFAAEEMHTINSPLIVYLAVTVDGRPYAVRIVHSPDLELTTFTNKDLTEPQAAPEAEAAFKAASKALIGAMAADIPAA